MRLKPIQILTGIYFLLIFIFLKKFNLYSVISFFIIIALDYLFKFDDKIKNLFYFLAAISFTPEIFFIFLLYLPFAVFGMMLGSRLFIRDYIIGFTLSFIPSTLIYLITTYLSVKLNYFMLMSIFYLPVALALVVLRKNSIKVFRIGQSESIFLLVVMFFTVIVAINILDDKSLFIANSVREFYRVETVSQGLRNSGTIPIYDPNLGSGEATFLWVPPSYGTHFGLSSYFLNFLIKSPLFFFNAQTFFILLLSTFSLGMLFFSILNKKKTTMNFVTVAAVTVLIGLNFYFLHFLESIKQFYTYASAYLLLSMIIDNPKNFTEYFIIMFIALFIVTIHPAYGIGVFILSACIFILRKLYYFKNRNEIKNSFSWIIKNKFRIALVLLILFLIPLFYISTSFTFKEFLFESPGLKLSLSSIIPSERFFRDFYITDNILSFRYPDVSRMDEHKLGGFITLFGMLSFLFILFAALIKIKTNHYWIYAGGYILNVVILSIVSQHISTFVGGFYRTPHPFLLIMLGASILVFISIFKNKYIRLCLTAVVFIGFLHTVPFASENLKNIHVERFMGEDIYKEEIEFIKQLPKDGRIMSYGLFSNVVDYGMSYFTDRHFSRNERIELAINRTIHERIHGQNSFGEPDMVLTKSGQELANYLSLGGYKYVFIYLQHPIGNYVAQQLYPYFSYPIYQNGPMVFLAVNKTNYAEKVELVESIGNELYKTKEGYKYVGISPNYNFEIEKEDAEFVEAPKEPEKLDFARIIPTEVRVFGSFDGEWVLFKEQYFTRWKAYMGGKEVLLVANNHDNILIKTTKGNEILLKYSLLGIERLYGILSMLGLFGAITIFIFLLRNSTVQNAG